MHFPSSVVDLLQALIRIPSVNPSGNPGTDQTGERACAEYVLSLLQEWGADAELRTVLPDRPNVIGRFPSKSASKTKKLLFVPHLDTVSVTGMTIDPFGGEVSDGKIWGRGASDTKGSMAAMLWAIFLEQQNLSRGDWEIWFAATVGEEAGQQGARALAEQERFDFVIAGEPTQMCPVYAHKGSAWFTLRTSGVAAHSSQPEKGVNAIYKMQDVIRFLRETLSKEFETLNTPPLGSPTLSVGEIRGGSKINIVPDFCEIDLDIRTIPSIASEAWAESFQKRLAENFPDLESHLIKCAPALLTSPDHPVIRLIERLGKAPTTAPWFCDASIFAEKNTPAIAMGPGSITQAHTKDEFISVEDLEEGAAFFQKFLQELSS